MSHEKPITKENLDFYLKELAKEYRKLNGKLMPAEIILVGGAAALANYGFRNVTYDIDVIIRASSAMKDAINNVGDRFDLPNGWINTDFTKTDSYSSKLFQYSQYYKTFSNIVSFRTVTAEYLIAMKLKSGREYKNDLSDIVGIVKAEKGLGNPLTFEKVDNAVNQLYGSRQGIDQDLIERLKSVLNLSVDRLEDLYKTLQEREKENKKMLIEFEKKYPKKLNNSNIKEVLASMYILNTNSKIIEEINENQVEEEDINLEI
ncbi:DUF6036 family nucleotidyltransferase [Holdemania massiliensis]|uniref:DUF6036 family nucleotidyltransferase n=1 Tax=Holdemania massiliensis TaxID=1468449 RepID=UPI001F052EEB|nr:DUF6036 family nucleotidyltransferase [Holdemania massiliensis]MCH1942415.1 DUF6036 family nucleotidyltransferase [Holdemania massiliensis]